MQASDNWICHPATMKIKMFTNFHINKDFRCEQLLKDANKRAEKDGFE